MGGLKTSSKTWVGGRVRSGGRLRSIAGGGAGGDNGTGMSEASLWLTLGVFAIRIQRYCFQSDPDPSGQ